MITIMIKNNAYDYDYDNGIAIPMGIIMIMITIILLLDEIDKYAFRCWGQFLESPDNQRAPKSCLPFIFKIEVSIIFKMI